MFEGKAAVVREKASPLVIEDVKLGSPRHDEVVVRIVGTGVCHTDMVVRDQAIRCRCRWFSDMRVRASSRRSARM